MPYGIYEKKEYISKRSLIAIRCDHGIVVMFSLVLSQFKYTFVEVGDTKSDMFYLCPYQRPFTLGFCFHQSQYITIALIIG